MCPFTRLPIQASAMAFKLDIRGLCGLWRALRLEPVILAVQNFPKPNCPRVPLPLASAVAAHLAHGVLLLHDAAEVLVAGAHVRAHRVQQLELGAPAVPPPAPATPALLKTYRAAQPIYLSS